MKSWKVKDKSTSASEIAGGTRDIGSEHFRGKGEAATIVSRLCVEAGFKPTGEVLKRFPKDYFEKVGLKAEFENHLVENQIPRACSNQLSLIGAKLDLLELEPSTVFSGGLIVGVPGCGKTTLLKNLVRNLPDCVLLYGARNLDSEYRSIPNCWWFLDFLVASVETKFNILLIDEYTLCPGPEVLLVQRKIGASKIFLFGDRAQGDPALLSSSDWLKFPCLFEKRKSHRFGESTANCLKKFGFDLEGDSEVKDQVEIAHYFGDSEETEVNLCFSEATQLDLKECGIDSLLVNSVQGKTFGTVTLFISDVDGEAVQDKWALLVGLTRHRNKLIVRQVETLARDSDLPKSLSYEK